MTVPWFTIGGADTVVEMAVRRWTDAGRTVIMITTHEIGPGMANRVEDLRAVTPYIYQLPDLLPEHLWGDFVAGVVGSLESAVLWNVGSAWLYRQMERLRTEFPSLVIADQQFNEIGHIDSNRKAAESINVTVAAYEGLAEKLRADGRLSPVKPIYVGIDLADRPAAPAVNKFRQGLGVGNSQHLVLYVGRLSEEKRPEWMVELARELNPVDTKVALIGNGPLRSVISDAAESNPELIWIEETDSVLEAISAADIIALPSRTEGIPLVALEALALGTPIVATAVGGLPDLEEIEGVTLTDPTDFEDFIRGVKTALEGPYLDIGLPAEFRAESMLEELDTALFGSIQSSQ